LAMDSLSFPGHLCYVLSLLRVLPWWWRRGRHAAAQPSIPAPQRVHWLAYPLAVWFLWPKRVAGFIWYMTRTPHGGDGPLRPWPGRRLFARPHHPDWSGLWHSSGCSPDWSGLRGGV